MRKAGNGFCDNHVQPSKVNLLVAVLCSTKGAGSFPSHPRASELGC
jgi:hypothetical protein